MKELSPLLMSAILHLGIAYAAWHAPQYFKWNEEKKEEKLVHKLELIPAKVNRVVPVKKQPKIPKKKKLVQKAKPKKARPKKKAVKKKLITQKQKSPIKVKQSKAQKAVAKAPKVNKAKVAPKVAVAKKAPEIGPKGSSDPLNPEDGRLLRQAAGNIPPDYPTIDRIRRNTGRVIVIGYVNPMGRVSQVRIGESTGTPAMEESSMEAFSDYRFQKGQEGWVKMPYEFILGGTPKVMSVYDSRQYE